MPTDERNESYLELFDVSKKTQVARVPLASISFMPRTGERIFLPLHKPGEWNSYTVIAVEYFLGPEAPPGQAAQAASALGMVRVTLYVEESR
jgi:hypothetical protein